jgi:hypothetical protein
MALICLDPSPERGTRVRRPEIIFTPLGTCWYWLADRDVSSMDAILAPSLHATHLRSGNARVFSEAQLIGSAQVSYTTILATVPTRAIVQPCGTASLSGSGELYWIVMCTVTKNKHVRHD